MEQKITAKEKSKKWFDKLYSTTYYKSYWKYNKALKRNNILAFLTIVSLIVLIISSLFLNRMPMALSFLMVILILISLYSEIRVGKRGRLLKKDSRALGGFLGISTFDIFDGAYLLNTKQDEQSLEVVMVPRQAILRRLFKSNQINSNNIELEKFSYDFESDIKKLLTGTAKGPQNQKVYHVYGTIPISLLRILKEHDAIKIENVNDRAESLFKLTPNKKDTIEQKPFLCCNEWKMVTFKLK